MNAILSASAGVAIVVDGKSLFSIDIDQLDEVVPRRPRELPYLLGDAEDQQIVEGVDTETVKRLLDEAWRGNEALQLALILMDGDLSDETRALAAAELEEALGAGSTKGQVEAVLWSRPLPPDAGIEAALALCERAVARSARRMFEQVRARQAEIREVWETFEGLPEPLFGDDVGDRARARASLVREGAFRELVAAREGGKGVGAAAAMLLFRPGVRAVQNHRAIIATWIKPLGVARRDEGLEAREAEPASEREERKPPASIDRAKVLENVNSQKQRIVGAMVRNDLVRARGLVDELVDYQRKTGGATYAVKSLCDLAMEAQRRSLHAFQVDLLTRATSLKADDGWTWAQLGKALLNVQRNAEALSAYESASAFGQGGIAKKGRAEVLKAMGRHMDALDSYDDALRDNPGDVVAKNGRAEVLKAMGRHTDALAAYDAALEGHPEDVVVRNGRAEVLKAMGRHKDALAAYDDALRGHPGNVVVKNGRAEVLKAMGRHTDALAAYDDALRGHPENVVAKNGRAEVLKAMGRHKDALAAYDDALNGHPGDVVAKTGRAEVLKAMGRHEDAFDAFDDALKGHPGDVVAKNGRAEVLKAMGRHEDALDAYDATLKGHPGDVVAKNGRAEVLKAMGRHEDALDAYDDALKGHPGDVFAKIGRAEVLKAMGRHKDALGAYDATLKDHPRDVFAKTGRAEVLKAMGRHEDALGAYDAALKDHPGDLVARNGRAATLASMGRWEDALQALPREPPQIEQDWIAHHIRGMILLRSGDLSGAEQVFEHGIQHCPFAGDLDYFRSALAVVRLRRQKYGAALALLTEVTLPALQVPANVLRTHVHGLQGDGALAAASFARIPTEGPPLLLDVREVLRKLYIDHEPTPYNDSWLFEREAELLAAA